MTATTMDPSTRFVRSLEGNYYMVREAAEMLGVRHQKLRDLLRVDPELGPSYCAFFGKTKIYLYTEDDIARIRKHFTEHGTIIRRSDVSRIGRPPIWTPEQKKLRQRLYSGAHYYRKRVERLTQEGDAEGAAAAQARVDDFEKRINEMRPELRDA